MRWTWPIHAIPIWEVSSDSQATKLNLGQKNKRGGTDNWYLMLKTLIWTMHNAWQLTLTPVELLKYTSTVPHYSHFTPTVQLGVSAVTNCQLTFVIFHHISHWRHVSCLSAYIPLLFTSQLSFWSNRTKVIKTKRTQFWLFIHNIRGVNMKFSLKVSLY